MKYIIKKIIGLIITLLIVSILAFFAFEVIPGDPARTILGTEATESKVQALREEMGLNRPLTERYVQWGKDFLTGDMGISYFYQIPVREMIGDKLPITVAMTVLAFCFTLLLSVPVSILSVRYENHFFDRMFLILNQVTMSIPPFFIGIIFTVIFGLVFRWFTPGGYVSYTESMSGFLSYLILPSLAIALPRAAMTTKMLRNSLIAEMHQDYVRTAYSRGNSPWRVLLCHAFRDRPGGHISGDGGCRYDRKQYRCGACLRDSGDWQDADRFDLQTGLSGGGGDHRTDRGGDTGNEYAGGLAVS